MNSHNKHVLTTNGAQVMKLNVLKEFARHGKVEMTLRYTHTAKAEAAEAVNRLPPLRDEPARRRNRRMEPVQPDQNQTRWWSQVEI